MKFGVQFDFHKIPEWSEYYINYKALKKLLKENIKKLKELEVPIQKNKVGYNNRNKSSTSINNLEKQEKLLNKDENDERKGSDQLSNSSSNTIESNEPQDEYFISWRDKFIEYLNIVNTFYKSKYLETREDFESLKLKMSDKKKEFVQKHSIIQTRPINEQSILEENSVNEFKKTIRINIERDELGYAVSWKRAFSQVYNTTSWLQGYCTINRIACQKILKKFKKNFRKINEEKTMIIFNELSELCSKILFCENSKEMDTISLRIEIKDFYAEYFTNGNQLSAINSLQSRMKPYQKRDIFNLAFNCGLFTMQLFFLIIAVFSDNDTENSLETFFPCFSFTLMIILCFFGLAINVIIFRKYRINYIYIFEVDPKSRLTHIQILKTGLTFLNIWFLLLNFTFAKLHYQIFFGKYYIYVFCILFIILSFIIWPFHCFYFTLRLAILKTFRNNIFPIGAQAVKFRDFMFGDLLTSLTRPFNSLTLTFCLLTCNNCLENNIRIDCFRNDIPGLVVNLLPFVIRFLQCINRYYYTKMAWPNLANALKYACGIAFAVINWKFSSSDRLLVIIVGVVNTSYLLFWDVRMDWNLGYFNIKYFFLRDKLLYPISFYYIAIILNFILRFTWFYNFFITQDILHDETKIFIFSILEIYRRTQWALFRVENENQNNFEKYRTFLEIPELPTD